MREGASASLVLLPCSQVAWFWQQSQQGKLVSSSPACRSLFGSLLHVPPSPAAHTCQHALQRVLKGGHAQIAGQSPSGQLSLQACRCTALPCCTDLFAEPDLGEGMPREQVSTTREGGQRQTRSLRLAMRHPAERLRVGSTLCIWRDRRCCASACKPAPAPHPFVCVQVAPPQLMPEAALPALAGD